MSMSIIKLSVAKDFSEFPAGRHLDDGPHSGERFREEFLVPGLKSDGPIVEVDLDGTMGYGSSFLEEAFGGLVRKHRFDLKTLNKRLKLKDSRKIYERIIWQYIQDENVRIFGK
jgi:hypothetical protein